ncbi:MAG: dephospho-CoA kinase [Mariprofundaceae bacterium]
MRQPARIGLTGGIGSGKSTAAAMFSALGVPVLDLDQVGRSLAMPGSLCLQRLVTAFGEGILLADGSLNRMKLASLCFEDADKTARLNAIMHPLIRQEEQAWLTCQQADFAIIEASVLIESGGAERMDAVIAILADEGLRRRRVLDRGLQDNKGFERILRRQCGDAERRRVADYLIINEGDLSELERQVKSINRHLLVRFATPES